MREVEPAQHPFGALPRNFFPAINPVLSWIEDEATQSYGPMDPGRFELPSDRFSSAVETSRALQRDSRTIYYACYGISYISTRPAIIVSRGYTTGTSQQQGW